MGLNVPLLNDSCGHACEVDQAITSNLKYSVVWILQASYSRRSLSRLFSREKNGMNLEDQDYELVTVFGELLVRTSVVCRVTLP